MIEAVECFGCVNEEEVVLCLVVEVGVELFCDAFDVFISLPAPDEALLTLGCYSVNGRNDGVGYDGCNDSVFNIDKGDGSCFCNCV